MKLLVRGLLAFGLALVLSLTVSAEEKKKEVKKEDVKKEAKKDAPKKPAVNQLFTFPKNMKPAATEEQIQKMADLEKKYVPQMAEISKKIAAIQTPELAKARQAAIKQAATDGKKGKEAQEAGYAALKLSDDQLKGLKELEAARGKLGQEINKEKVALLTDEQKASLKAPAKKPEPKKENKTEPKKESKTEPKKESKTEPKKEAK